MTTLSEKHEAALIRLVENFPLDPPRMRRPKRGFESILVGRVIATALQQALGSDASRVSAAIRKAGVSIGTKQIATYFNGRFTPQRNVIVQIAHALNLPDLLMVFSWPWDLLSDLDLGLSDIETICDPPYETPFILPNDVDKSVNSRGRSRWHRHLAWDPREYWLDPPSDPETFWQHVARYRAADALRDYESTNSHRWSAIASISSIVTHPFVMPNAEWLYRCIQRLTIRTPRCYVWFTADWDIIRSTIVSQAFGPWAAPIPFRDIVSGSSGDVGRPCADADGMILK